jgi:hypothetical protein
MKNSRACFTCMVWWMVMLWRHVCCIGNDTPCVNCQTERHLKESIAAYANMGVLHIHQAWGTAKKYSPWGGGRYSQRYRSKSWSQHKAVRTAEVCAAHDDLETATRTPTLSTSSTSCTRLVSCGFSYKSNVLLVVPATMWYESELWRSVTL